MCITLLSQADYFFFLMKKNLGELGPGGSPGSGQASRLKERLQRYLQIVHQQGPHIGRIRTHNHIVINQTPLPIGPTFVGQAGYFYDLYIYNFFSEDKKKRKAQ